MSETSKIEFRLIPYGQFDGALNMAIDEVLLDQYNDNYSDAPVLRFYGWKPPAVSIGYGQNLSPSNLQAIQQKGIDVVRRPTGGRAVLHQNEFTYSFIGGASEKKNAGAVLGKSILQAYKQICQGLVFGFESLGLNVELGTSSKGYKNNADCFMATTTADLHISGKKLVGSAQLRRGESVLQHGSIILNQPDTLMAELLGKPKTSTGQRHANLFDQLGKHLPLNELERVFVDGFERAFNCQFKAIELRQAELEKANSIRKKFAIDNSIIDVS